MNVFDIFRNAYHTVITSTVSGVANSNYLNVMFDRTPNSQFYAAESNRLADAAMEWGLAGRAITAEYAAALADSCAELSRLWAWIESSSHLPKRSA